MVGPSKEEFAARTCEKAVWMLETMVYHYLGSRPVDKIVASDVLKTLKRIESRDLNETAHRVRQRISEACRYAVGGRHAPSTLRPTNYTLEESGGIVKKNVVPCASSLSAQIRPP